MTKQESIKASVWDKLSRTDPAHTKGFKRAGGFSGTALKPIWVVKQLTDVFGPVGEGWGMGEPKFELVNAGDEGIGVYCYVMCWHTTPENTFWGVGGDKAVGKNKYGLTLDDEAFKKAYTDAVMNAFKYVGVGADIHMGLFDDSKYVEEVREEFEREANGIKAKFGPRKDGDLSDSDLKSALRRFVTSLRACDTQEKFDTFLADEWTRDITEQAQRRADAWWSTGEGLPAEWVPIKDQIAAKHEELEEQPATVLDAG